MVRVQVQGRDPIAEAYRVETDAGRAIVPECLIDTLRPGTRPTHQEAYEWIAANRRRIADAVDALTRGKTPRRPFDIVTLDDTTASAVSDYLGEQERLARRPSFRIASDRS